MEGGGLEDMVSDYGSVSDCCRRSSDRSGGGRIILPSIARCSPSEFSAQSAVGSSFFSAVWFGQLSQNFIVRSIICRCLTKKKHNRLEHNLRSARETSRLARSFSQNQHAVRWQIFPRFLLPTRPTDFQKINLLPATQSKVKT